MALIPMIKRAKRRQKCRFGAISVSECPNGETNPRGRGLAASASGPRSLNLRALHLYTVNYLRQEQVMRAIAAHLPRAAIHMDLAIRTTAAGEEVRIRHGGDGAGGALAGSNAAENR